MGLDSVPRLIAIERSGILLVKRQEMLVEVCKALYEALSVDDVQVNVITATHQIFVAEWPKPKRRRKPNPLTNSGCREVILANQPVVIPDSREHPIMCTMPWVKEWLGYLGVPLRYEGQPLGTLCVLTRKVRQWTPEDVALVESHAERIARSF
jgi:GAF domain-containing protein